MFYKKFYNIGPSLVRIHRLPPHGIHCKLSSLSNLWPIKLVFSIDKLKPNGQNWAEFKTTDIDVRMCHVIHSKELKQPN